MKRLWLGLTILAVLLLSGCLIYNRLDKMLAPIATDLELAAAAALQDDWGTARDLAVHAAIRWEKFHRFTAAFADHTPMDELDSLFAELTVYARQQEKPHFAAICAHLSFLSTTIADSHRLTWWNLL